MSCYVTKYCYMLPTNYLNPIIIFQRIYFSYIIIPALSLPETHLREVGPHPFPRLHHSMRSDWIFSCIWFAQFGKSADSKLLFAAFLAGSRHNGTIRVAVCFWLLHVSWIIQLVFCGIPLIVKKLSSHRIVSWCACAAKMLHTVAGQLWCQFMLALDW